MVSQIHLNRKEDQNGLNWNKSLIEYLPDGVVIYFSISIMVEENKQWALKYLLIKLLLELNKVDDVYCIKMTATKL